MKFSFSTYSLTLNKFLDWSGYISTRSEHRQYKKLYHFDVIRVLYVEFNAKIKHYLTILLTLITLNSFSQNQEPKELGIGLAVASDPYQFERLSKPKSLYRNQELTENWTTESVFPFFLKPDYGLYNFICLEKTDRYYKILANDNTVGYIPNDENFYFKSWDAILLQSTVQRLSKDNPIRLEPNDESQVILNECANELLTVQDVIQKNGEFWLQINFSTECDPYIDENSKTQNGWIKWKTKNELLINILLLC